MATHPTNAPFKTVEKYSRSSPPKSRFLMAGAQPLKRSTNKPQRKNYRSNTSVECTERRLSIIYVYWRRLRSTWLPQIPIIVFRQQKRYVILATRNRDVVFCRCSDGGQFSAIIHSVVNGNLPPRFEVWFLPQTVGSENIATSPPERGLGRIRTRV